MDHATEMLAEEEEKGKAFQVLRIFFFLSKEKKKGKRKRNHLRDRAKDYCHLFWETMLVLLDSNQSGGEAMAAQGILESLWLRVGPSELSPGVGHNWTRRCVPGILLSCTLG